MARNSEKAQSMLYRFRESQAIEMGLGNRMKGDRRPRMASSVTSLRECERWRGDILRDISRKVSKIQDATLTDYQVRDLNDEINALMREKRHYENQIVALGGANYKRGNQSMVDDDGKEVPGTRGYKYFGRAKELPGVREMFNKGAQQASEESARNASFQMFRNQGTEYYGDNDDMDGKLAEEEDEMARQEWEAAVARTAAILSLPEGTSVPYPIAPSQEAQSSSQAANETDADATDSKPKSTPAKGKKGAKATTSKRKSKRKAGTKGTDAGEDAADEDDEDHDGEVATTAEEGSKKAKTDKEGGTTEGSGTGAAVVNGDVGALAATAAAEQEKARAAAIAHSFGGVLDVDSLKMPVVPTREQMGEILLDVRKKALREEYGV